MIMISDKNGQASPFWAGLPHCVGFIAMDLLILALLRCLVLGVMPPEGGFPTSDEPVGRYPTIHHHPKNETINPAEGVTPKTPAVKPHPKGGEEVISFPP